MAVGVIALALVGWSVWRGTTGESGGASSPEEAVRSLVSAVNSEDPAGALAVLAPDEVRNLADSVDITEQRAQSQGLAGESNPYDGLDIEIDGLELEVEELSDDAVRVDIVDGAAEWRIQRDDLGANVQPGIEDASYDGTIDRDDLVYQDRFWAYDGRAGQEREHVAEVEPFLIVVKQGGGWYVSPLHTAVAWYAEYFGLSDGNYDIDPSDDLPAAETPEDAAVQLVDTIDRLDPEETMESLPTREFGFLLVYQDAVEDYIGRSVEGAGGFQLDVNREDLIVEELSDGRRKVVIEGASGTYEVIHPDGFSEFYEWELDGLCLEWSGPGGLRSDCLDGNPELGSLWDALDIDEPFVVVEQDRGGWVVSPMATLMHYGEELLPRVPDAWIYRQLGLWQVAPTDVEAAVGEPVSGEFNDAGYAVVDVDLEAGQRVAVADDGYVDVREVYGPDGEVSWGVLRGEQPAGPDGRYRLVVYGQPGSGFGFTLVEPVVEDLRVGDRASGTLGPDHPVALYRFTPARTGEYDLVAYDGFDVDVGVVDEDGVYICFSTCTLDAGIPYIVAVSSLGSGDIPYEVAIEEVRFSGTDALSTGGPDDFGAEGQYTEEVPGP